MSTIKVNTLTTLDGTGNITFDRPIVGDASGLTGVTVSKAAVEALGIDLPAANLTGSIAGARLPNPLPAIDGSNLTGVAPTKTTVEALGIELPAANLTGTVADARFPATLPASSGVNLTALNASNISSGTLPSGRYTDTVYTHPTTAGNKHIPTAGATDQVLTYSSSGTAAWADPAASGLTNGSNVVSTTITDARDQSATHSWADITGGFQAIITPSATTSDILVMLNISSSNNNDHHFFRVVRDGSQITGGVGDAAGSRCRSFTEEYYTGVSGNMHRGSASWFVDTSVSTTSAVTYKVQLWGGSGVRINRGGNDSDNGGHARALSTLTLIELL